jgi:hypothetical protein
VPRVRHVGSGTCLGAVLCAGLGQTSGVGAAHLENLLARLEDAEGRHGLDSLIRGNIGELINVDLGEDCVGVLAGEFRKDGRDAATRRYWIIADEEGCETIGLSEENRDFQGNATHRLQGPHH